MKSGSKSKQQCGKWEEDVLYLEQVSIKEFRLFENLNLVLNPASERPT